jgi:hypothetical protein
MIIKMMVMGMLALKMRGRERSMGRQQRHGSSSSADSRLAATVCWGLAAVR